MIDSCEHLLEAAETLGFPLDPATKEAETAINAVLELEGCDRALKYGEIAVHIATLWADSGIQKCLGRKSEFYVSATLHSCLTPTPAAGLCSLLPEEGGDPGWGGISSQRRGRPEGSQHHHRGRHRRLHRECLLVHLTTPPRTHEGPKYCRVVFYLKEIQIVL